MFEKSQIVVDIAGISIGGQPGEFPTVLIGSLFYPNHKIVHDFEKAQFDKDAAETLLNQQDSLSEKTGNPCIVDIIGNTPDALIAFIDFVADTTEAPFLIDGARADIRLPAAKHAIEIGLKDRAIYNSLEYNTEIEEFTKLKDFDIKNAIILAYNPKNVWPEGTLDLLKGTSTQPGLVQKCTDAQITNILIDTAVLDVPSISISAKAIHLIKTQLGLPVGCCPSNAIGNWKKLRAEFSYDAYTATSAASGIIPITMGGDFIIYGPMAFAERVFPIVAMTDSLIAYHARRLGIQTKSKNHPLYKIFRE